MIKIPITINEIENEACHITVNAVFNELETGILIIDTGASRTVLDKKLSKNLIQVIDQQIYLEKNTKKESTDLRTKEKANTEDDRTISLGVDTEKLAFGLGVLKKLSIGDFSIENVSIATIDLSNINKIYKSTGKPEVLGLLGGDFLLKYRAIINYNKKTLSLEENEFAD